MAPGPFGAANVLSPTPPVPPKPPPNPLPKAEPPMVPKVDVVEVPKVEGPVGPNPDEADALSPNALLVAGVVLFSESAPSADALALFEDPRVPNGLAPSVVGEAPKVPKGEVLEFERAAKPEDAKAEEEV